MLVALACLTFATAAEDWTAISPPALCTPAARSAIPLPLLDGSHLKLTGAEAPLSGDGSYPVMPLATFQQMLEEDARVHGAKLELQRQTGACLVRGDAAAIAGARALAADLDRAAKALEIRLSVELSSKKGEAFERRFSVDSRRMRSGDTAFFGQRDVRAYVGGFDVEVAADSGSSEPVVGHALAGQCVHVRAARVDGGKRVFVWGVLDLAEIAEVKDFDPSTPDLGVVQQPSVHSAQVVFSGVVDASGTLTVDLAGTPLSSADWRLSIRAQTGLDADLAADGASEASGWNAIDLSFLAGEPMTLESADPGSNLRAGPRANSAESNVSGLPPSALAAMVEASRGGNSGGSFSSNKVRAPLFWSDRVLFVPRADAAANREARALVRGLESARLATGTVTLTSGKTTAKLPVCAGLTARVLVGVERPYLVDYRLEVAPQIWMPAPTIENAFDGVCLEIAAEARALECSLWVATSEPVVELEREAAQVGRLQLLSRSLRSASSRVDASAPWLSESGPGAGTTVQFEAP
jgi:hypothetical protein